MIKFSFLALVLTFVANSSATTFKCQDDKGGVTFSDTPCDKKFYEIIELETEDLAIESEDAEQKLDSEFKTWFWDLIEDIGLYFYQLRADKPSSKEQESLFACEGKKVCSEMFSCEEATFYLKQCSGVNLPDEDEDGIPCENHWCQ